MFVGLVQNLFLGKNCPCALAIENILFRLTFANLAHFMSRA